jgi:hypothetical protein
VLRSERGGVSGRQVSRWAAWALLPALACASQPPPPPASPAASAAIAALAAPAPPPPRLAWLPVDPLMYPGLGEAVNHRLEAIRLPGVAAHDRSPLSMETAQLSLECSQPTPQCRTAVGRHLKANRLLWAEVLRGKRGRGMTVTLLLFDVDKAEMAARSEAKFANQKAALAGLDALVTQLTASASQPISPQSTAAR